MSALSELNPRDRGTLKTYLRITAAFLVERVLVLVGYPDQGSIDVSQRVKGTGYAATDDACREGSDWRIPE